MLISKVTFLIADQRCSHSIGRAVARFLCLEGGRAVPGPKILGGPRACSPGNFLKRVRDWLKMHFLRFQVQIKMSQHVALLLKGMSGVLPYSAISL